MYDWNKKHMPEPEPPPLTRWERFVIYIRKKDFPEKYGAGTRFLIVYGAPAVLILGILVAQGIVLDNEATVGVYILAGILSLGFAALGVVYILFPEKMWEISHFLSVSGGEPTDLYIFFRIVGGIVTVVLSIVIAFSPWFVFL